MFVNIEKNARGGSYQIAKNRAEEINYNYALKGNELELDGFFIFDSDNKFRDQEVEVTVYLPIGAILYADNNTYSFHRIYFHHERHERRYPPHQGHILL